MSPLNLAGIILYVVIASGSVIYGVKQGFGSVLECGYMRSLYKLRLNYESE